MAYGCDGVYLVGKLGIGLKWAEREAWRTERKYPFINSGLDRGS